eukprot:CAMPEP_0117884060 /NCGR_PEP_ID=MMETSP0950-20121206/18606_1 /TAXON_ID=44440 /ORGANISM="Chattonella subsalsa, Strain CCMP2191" /LENGTH=157 /DNA_ID=CAMNT_0005740257 /DNA_START=21 /DNA_END=494 /DNA_ORIENTATION=+
MTSNLGSDLLQQNGSPQDKREEILHVVRKNYMPEFLNRIDDIIIFNRIEKDQAFQIVQIQLEKLQDLLGEKDITLSISERAIKWLVDKGFSPQFGARPLKRAIQTHLMNPMATLMLKGEIRNGQTVQISSTLDDSIGRTEQEGVESSSDECLTIKAV